MKIRCLIFATIAMLGFLSQASAGIYLVGHQPGATSPPSTVGGYAMTAYGQGLASGGNVTQFTDLGLTTTFDRQAEQTTVQSGGWGSWSQGYQGTVWSTATDAYQSLTITLPTDTKAVYFYAQPANSGTYGITLNYSGAQGNPLTQLVSGQGGAQFFGIYTDDPANESLGTFTLSTSDTAGFAVGRFALNNPNLPSVEVPEPATIASFIAGLSLIGVGRRRKRS